ncbi:MAG TPA: ATP-binding protein, partial [Burkholderiales bacterium]|nr:ATP-binding protein [Burkholderiales bacterium]
MARPGAQPLNGAPAGLLAALRARLASRPDTEHEQALIRLLNAIALGIYLMPEIQPYFGIWLIYFVVGLAIVADILIRPQPSPVRRTLGALSDVSTLTWTLVQFGEHSAPLFLAYLWITLANGFRFGASYLMISLAFSVVGFGIALMYGDFWAGHTGLSIGLMVGLVALSLYVRKLVTQLFDALARAEAANQAKRRFISVVSHEMRTPLNAIIGMADLLRDTPLTREQADMLQTLRSSSRVMLGLVEDVLDFSKIEAGKVVIERTDFDLHALVNSTCRIVAAQAAAKGLDFVVSIMPEVPPAVRGDPHYLRQVLINLAGNAVKFTERGSVTVHVSAQGETANRVRLKFSIRDTGIGIAPEAQARVFESFAQADQSMTRRFGGTGLGTTIAKQLVGLMGGSIGLESAVGLGSTFWFEVEIDKQPERAAGGSGELADARVLLIGFPQAQREALEQALTGWGATAVAVAGIDEGVARMTADISLASPYRSALIYASGHDVKLAQRFRRAAPDPAPPTVLAVPRDADVPRFEALSSGFGAVLELPFDKRQLFNVLHSVSAGDEVLEGVVRLQDYARRGSAARKLRVLVADDNPTNREVVGRILERGGHSVTLVGDGERALDELERERPDIVL